MTTVHFLKAKFHRFFTPVRNLNRLGYSKNSCPRSKDTPILYSYPTQKPTKFIVWITKNWTQNWPTTWNWLTLLYMCLALLEKKKHFEYLVAETETRTGTGTRSRASLLLELEYLDHRCLILEKLELELELEPQHRASLFLEPWLKHSCNSFICHRF